MAWHRGRFWALFLSMLQTRTHTHTQVLSHSKGFVCLHSDHTDPIGTGVEASLLNTHAHLRTHRLVHTDQCISWSSLASACTGGCWDHEPVKTQCWITQFQLISLRSLISASIQVLSASTVLLEAFFSPLPRSHPWCEHFRKCDIINFIEILFQVQDSGSVNQKRLMLQHLVLYGRTSTTPSRCLQNRSCSYSYSCLFL